MNVITELTGTLGKFYIVAGLVPALLFALAHSALTSSGLGERLPVWIRSLPELGEMVFPLGEDLGRISVSLLLGALIPIVLGALLMMLNHVLIQLFEGRPNWLKNGLLRPLLRRNHNAWEKIHRGAERDKLALFWQQYRALALNYELMEGDRKQATLRSLQDVAAMLARIDDKLAARGRWPRFPAEKEGVLPTAMGNAWAVIEEYPFRRYGMDGVIYWPRLLPLLESESEKAPFAPSLASRIANQKTIFDALFHLALLTGLFGLELGVLSLSDFSQAVPIFAFNLGALIGGLAVLSVAYGLYRAAVNSVYVLGDLFATAYDLLRPALADALGLTLPATPEAEYRLWQQMYLFLHRGWLCYHPASLSKQVVQPATRGKPGGGDQVQPELVGQYRVLKVPEPPQKPPA
jgi:hypothetical protein